MTQLKYFLSTCCNWKQIACIVCSYFCRLKRWRSLRTWLHWGSRPQRVTVWFSMGRANRETTSPWSFTRQSCYCRSILVGNTFVIYLGKTDAKHRFFLIFHNIVFFNFRHVLPHLQCRFSNQITQKLNSGAELVLYAENMYIYVNV